MVLRDMDLSNNKYDLNPLVYDCQSTPLSIHFLNERFLFFKGMSKNQCVLCFILYLIILIL